MYFSYYFELFLINLLASLLSKFFFANFQSLRYAIQRFGNISARYLVWTNNKKNVSNVKKYQLLVICKLLKVTIPNLIQLFLFNIFSLLMFFLSCCTPSRTLPTLQDKNKCNPLLKYCITCCARHIAQFVMFRAQQKSSGAFTKSFLVKVDRCTLSLIFLKGRTWYLTNLI